MSDSFLYTFLTVLSVSFIWFLLAVFKINKQLNKRDKSRLDNVKKAA